MVPLREELEHVKDYLQIEKARFEEKLQVTYEVPEKMEILVRDRDGKAAWQEF